MDLPAASERPLRILVGTFEIAGLLPDFADGFRQLGHSVTSVIRARNRFYPDASYDVDISVDAPDRIDWPSAIRRSRFPLVRIPRGAVNRLSRAHQRLQLIAQHDVFFFSWAGVSLTDGNTEFPLLKRLNKRIISLFCGSDVRSVSAYCQEFNSVETTQEWKAELADRTDKDPFRPLRSLRLAERYSDLVCSVPNQSSLAVRPYMHGFAPINLSHYAFRIPGREVPVVVHAPSSRAVKGTPHILAALDRLRAEGVRFDLRLLQGISNREVLSSLVEADVVVDQLFFPLHGKLGLEAMASGCALATGNRHEWEPFPPNRPIWHLDLTNLCAQLRTLLTDRDLRVRLAAEGRQYVEKYHAHVAVAKRMLESLQAMPRLSYDHYPTFFSRHFQLGEGPQIPEDLRRMTTRIVRRWGLPPGATAADLIARGLMSRRGLGARTDIPVWQHAPA